MGRPRLKTTRYRYYINMTLHAGKDDDLIALLAELPPRQRVQVVKAVLRVGLQVELAAEDGYANQKAEHKEAAA